MTIEEANEAGYQLVHAQKARKVARPNDIVRGFPGHFILERPSATGVHRIYGTSERDALMRLEEYLSRAPAAIADAPAEESEEEAPGEDEAQA